MPRETFFNLDEDKKKKSDLVAQKNRKNRTKTHIIAFFIYT